MRGERIVGMIILLFLLASCAQNDPKLASVDNVEQDDKSHVTTAVNSTVQDEEERKESVKQSFTVISENYKDRNVKIEYPQITGYVDPNKQEEINKLLRTEAMMPLEDYASSESEDELSLDVNYEITWMSERLLSVQYKGGSYSSDAAYPIDLFYSINIDMKQGTKVMLKDIIEINTKFVDEFREKVNDLEDEVLKSYILEQNTEEDLLQYLSNADSSGDNDDGDTYSYLSKDSLGISISVIHAAGDHVEIELSHQDIMQFIKLDNQILKDFSDL